MGAVLLVIGLNILFVLPYGFDWLDDWSGRYISLSAPTLVDTVLTLPSGTPVYFYGELVKYLES